MMVGNRVSLSLLFALCRWQPRTQQKEEDRENNQIIKGYLTHPHLSKPDQQALISSSFSSASSSSTSSQVDAGRKPNTVGESALYQKHDESRPRQATFSLFSPAEIQVTSPNPALETAHAAQNQTAVTSNPWEFATTTHTLLSSSPLFSRAATWFKVVVRNRPLSHES